MPPTAKKTYDVVQQGIEVLCDPENANVDIVAVPGLGANPHDSWQSADSKFNWLSDKEGLPLDFNRARVLLYLYESAWTGPLKVKQFLGNIATTLLHGLRSRREKCERRPLVFIGHSMGGLVIAKAVCLAESRRDIFPLMFETIAGCLFFGSPFLGAPVAAAAMMFAQLGQRVDKTTASKLLDLMKPGDEGLNELRNDFVRLTGKVTPKIELFCFWEEQPTDFAKLAGVPALSGIFSFAVPKDFQEFVSRDSATLLGVDQMGLASNHRDLVKFDGFKDKRYQLVRDPLQRIIRIAPLISKNRLNSTRGIDRALVKGVLDVLEGAQVQKKRKALAQIIPPSSWMTKEDDFVTWLSRDGPPEKQKGSCLWICGPEGRGKTSASIAAIDEVEAMIRTDDDGNSGQAIPVLAYFFCGSSQDYSTAEDVLKSLLRQLIYQQESLAVYAKHFVSKSNDQQGSKVKLSVENLWQSLQDMLTDDLIGSVYFVVNNIHSLPDDADSTLKLLEFIREELDRLDIENKKYIQIRWLFTSRKLHSIEDSLKSDGVRVIDLEDPRYENQVQLELRRHAQKKVALLGAEKKYNKALAYYASSVIGKRAQNTQWIDITCVQLAELPENENDLRVRNVLLRVPQDLKVLLNRAWLQVINSSDDDTERIKEMLRALVLVYEDPSDAELALLTGLSDSQTDRSEIRVLVESCKPLLMLRKSGKSGYTIAFMNAVVKTHLQENSGTLLALSDEEIKWQHGMIALRCFGHLTERLSYPPSESEEKPETTDGIDGQNAPAPVPSNNEETAEGNIEGKPGAPDKDDQIDTQVEAEQQVNEANDENKEVQAYQEATATVQEHEESSEDDEELSGLEEEELTDVETDEEISEDTQPESPETAKPLDYTVKHWLHHASKATVDIAEDLSCEEDFWKGKSALRLRWLQAYNNLTNDFEGFDPSTFTGLHVAASVGFTQLVASLLKHGHDKDINQRDSMINTPLHYAAYFGRVNIAEELLNKGADIDDAIEIHEATPLHMACFKGNVKMMAKLIRRGADPNALSNDLGPPICTAIYSGSREAVKLLVEQGVPLSHDNDDLPTPLALAAYLSDSSMFNYLVDTCKDTLPSLEYDNALLTASLAGRLEVLRTLLKYEHSIECFQTATGRAADEGNWDTVLVLLENKQGLDCNELFYSAAVGAQQQDHVLEAIWKYTDGGILEQTLNKSLYDATDNQKESTVRMLLESFHADPNTATGDEYGNALTASAYDGTEDIIKMLLAHGAEVDSPFGWALQTAAAQGHLGVVRILLENGANVNACIGEDHFPQGTALQAACEAGLRDIVKLLLEYHADPDLGAGPLTCPIIAAASQGENDILNQLVEAGAKLDILGGPNKWSPLVLAAAKLPVESAQKLLDAGATVDFETSEGDTALLVAAAVGDADCVRLLLNRGADILHVNAEGYNALQAALGDGGDAACLRLIIWRVSAALLAVKTAVNEGNNELAHLIREAAEKPVSGELGENNTQEDGSQESETSSPDKGATNQEGSQVDDNESIAPPDVPDEGTTSEPPPHDEEIPPSSRLVDQEEVAHPATDSEDESYNETVLPLRPRRSVDSDVQN